jgi:threonyl-tRNA synthetase
LKLFHIDEDVGQGLILWTPNGSIIRQELQNFISEELRKQGYSRSSRRTSASSSSTRPPATSPTTRSRQFAPVIENESLAKVIGRLLLRRGHARLEGRLRPARRQINERTGKEVHHRPTA